MQTLFIKAPNIWDSKVQQDMLSGKAKYLSGQWFKCGNNAEKLSRYVGMGSGGTIHLVHWQGSGKATNAKFKDALAAHKKNVK